jgi:hypothetical protein
MIVIYIVGCLILLDRLCAYSGIILQIILQKGLSGVDLARQIKRKFGDRRVSPINDWVVLYYMSVIVRKGSFTYIHVYSLRSCVLSRADPPYRPSVSLRMHNRTPG